mgnify:CR=1 FL=1
MKACPKLKTCVFFQDKMPIETPVGSMCKFINNHLASMKAYFHHAPPLKRENRFACNFVPRLQGVDDLFQLAPHLNGDLP